MNRFFSSSLCCLQKVTFSGLSTIKKKIITETSYFFLFLKKRTNYLIQSCNILGVGLSQLIGSRAVPYDDKYDDIPVPQSVIDETRDNTHW